ncbi:bombesin receptor subtype-3-like [Oculina patagonica]
MEELFADNNSTVTPSDSSTQFSAIRIMEIILYFTISLVGITANTMIFHTLLSRNNLRVGEYLILNLAITDLATCAVSIPFDLAERLAGGFPFGSILCFVVYPLQTVLMAVSVITLLSMSLERRRVVMEPFVRPRVLPKTAKIAIFVSWIAPTLIIIPYALVLRLDGENCLEKWSESWHVKVFTLTNFTVFFVIPIAVIAASYTMAGKKVRKELQNLNDMFEGTNRSRKEYIKKRTVQKSKVTKVFITAVVAFFVCMLPTHLAWIWHDFAQGSEHPHFKDILIFSNILMYLNSALNPFIFRSVRGKSFTRLITCCCKKFNENSATSSGYFPRCVCTPQSTPQVERERAIRDTKSFSRTSDEICPRFDVCYETSV